MWMFLCLLPFPVSISPSLSLCLSPLSVSFLRFGPPTAAAGKVLSPFLLLPHFLPPHSQCHTSVSVPSITFDLFSFWPLFNNCFTQISTSYLKSVTWDLRVFYYLQLNQRKTLFVQEMSTQSEPISYFYMSCILSITPPVSTQTCCVQKNWDNDLMTVSLSRLIFILLLKRGTIALGKTVFWCSMKVFHC